MKRVFIEHMYFDLLRETDVGGFPLSPEIVGQSASTGKVYGNTTRTSSGLLQQCGNSRRCVPSGGRCGICPTAAKLGKREFPRKITSRARSNA